MAASLDKLIDQLRSSDHAEALQAVETLRAEGWLSGGALQGARLRGADLRGADLRGADLRGADLLGVSLQGAQLEGANLQEANLTTADLRKASLAMADLRGANLFEAILQGVDLAGANLQGTTFEEPGYGRAMFDAATRLPDGTYWIPQSNVTRFTDQEQPDFWRSDDPTSPAFPGAGDEG